MNLLSNNLMYDTIIDLTFDLVMATLLSPGINIHLFPFIKSSKANELKEEIKEDKLIVECSKECKDCNKESISSEITIKEANKEASNELIQLMDKEMRDEDNFEAKAGKLFGQFLENTKSYLNQMFENEPTEDYIKQKENQLNKAHNFLTDVVLNQDPNFKVDKDELHDSFKYLENEFKKLDKLKDSVKLNPKSTNSIETNLVPSYFGGDSPSASSGGEDDDFEIIN